MKKKRTIKTLAGKLGVSCTTVYNYLKRPGITRAALWRIAGRIERDRARQRREASARIEAVWRAAWRPLRCQEEAAGALK